MLRRIYLMNVGRLRYSNGLKLQDYAVNLIKNGDRLPDTVSGILILVEHDPVYTVGIRSADYGPDAERKLRALGAEFHKTNRGGLITFHGPGQLVAYPILNLKHFRSSDGGGGVRWYVSQLENTVILTCRQYGLEACKSPHTGVWIDDKKVCAVGLRVSQYVSSHGLGLNCDTDLSWFKHIVPCGIRSKSVTSLTNECGRRVSVEEATRRFVTCFEQRFECKTNECPDELLNEAMGVANA